MTPRDFQAGSAVRALNPSVPEIGGYAPQAAQIVASESCEREGELHSAIMAECVKRGWKAFHGSMGHISRRTPAEPDFTICANLGRVFFVECKSKTGKLTVGQQAVHHQLRTLGHKPVVVRSFEEFLEAVK